MDRFTVSFTELDLMGDALGLDVRPFPFTFPSVGRDWDTRLRAPVDANDSMAERGLIRYGRFIPELERAVKLFAGGRSAVAVLGTGPDGPLIARGTRAKRSAVLAQQADDGVRIALGDDNDLVPWLLGLLPEHPRGHGESATIPIPADSGRTDGRRTDGRRTDGGRTESGRKSAPSGDFAAISYLRPDRVAVNTRERDKESAGEILGRERLGGGYFLVDGPSGEQYTLNWIDNDTGRYASYSTADRAGNESVVYAPADFPLLGRKLHGYLGAVDHGTKADTVASQFR